MAVDLVIDKEMDSDGFDELNPMTFDELRTFSRASLGMVNDSEKVSFPKICEGLLLTLSLGTLEDF